MTAAMAKTLLLVLTRPTGPATEPEFNTWYDSIHLAEVTGQVKAITAASRYDLTDPLGRTTQLVDGDGGQTSGPFGYPYAAIYEIESDHPEGVVQEILKRAAGDFDMSPTLDRSVAGPALLLLKPRDASVTVSHH
jgi:hypothetical protein